MVGKFQALEDSSCWKIPGTRKRSGFTLLELLAVMAILAILIGLASGGYQLARRSARDAQARAELELLRSAVEEYRIEYGAYPPASAGSYSNMVYALPAAQQRLMQDAARGTLPVVDPWGNAYLYASTNRFLYRIWSTGPDPDHDGDDLNPAQAGY
ncbi:type II secretion system protein [Pontiellaceae bacterium B12219]|nr:type II secretion system protein [Pontiellaceae bacterium B12219]